MFLILVLIMQILLLFSFAKLRQEVRELDPLTFKELREYGLIRNNSVKK